MSNDPFRERDPVECDCGKVSNRVIVILPGTSREVRICVECCGEGLRMQIRVFNGEFVMGENTLLKLRWSLCEEDEERLRVREEIYQESLPWNRFLKLIGVRR